MSVALWLVVLGLTGCTADFGANPAPRCETDTDCASSGRCYRGFCLGEGGGACLVEGATEPCSSRGVEGLEPRGECVPGTRECRDGAWTACTGEVLPASADPCNGRNDDCDGDTDEDPAPACGTGEEGVCGDGANVCAGGLLRCVVVNQPAPEVCDGDDDDCNGVIDDDLTRSCYPAAAGCIDNGEGSFDCVGQCAAGQVRCMEGEETGCLGAVVPAAAEACGTTPAADEDCDGEIDEGCPCGSAGETQPCYGGPPGTAGIGPCVEGTQTCDGTEWGPCMGAVGPVAETCANQGEDDDCNDMPDDIAGLSTSCMGSLPGVCALGVRQCNTETPSRLECMTPTPAPMEACDSRDDDCDSRVDEAYDLMTDRTHCGSCSIACTTGFDCCGGACIDTRTDETSCGACGRACTGAADTCCASTCVDTDSDELNCGGCGTMCAGGQTCCGGRCVNTSSSATNCGMCGTTCAGGQLCCGGTCAAPDSSACEGCSPVCAAGQICCSGTCVDPMTDEANCGACATMGGATCGPTDVCCGGTCGGANEHDACGESCTACTSSQLCCGGSCVPIGNMYCNACTVSCSTGSCCMTGCVDLSTDVTNCGTCGAACPGGQGCSRGHCCPTGQTWCDNAGPAGACVNLNNDDDHCGSCTNACGGLTPNCSAGRCVLL